MLYVQVYNLKSIRQIISSLLVKQVFDGDCKNYSAGSYGFSYGSEETIKDVKKSYTLFEIETELKIELILLLTLFSHIKL